MRGLLVALIFTMVSVAAGLKCYVCNNCIKFELSQSRQCVGALDNQCMKIDMITGQVQRRCGTTEICNDPEKHLRSQYKKVSCCEEGNCNTASHLTYQLYLPTVFFVYKFHQYA